jgi:hypothetical protein
MLAVFVRNSKIVQSTGMSFAVLGTPMHMLNVANLMTPALSHTWSAIAIAGFFMTASSQIGRGLAAMMPSINSRRHGGASSSSPASPGGAQHNSNNDDDVALP